MPGTTTARTAPSDQLVGYIAGLLPATDWHRAHRLAANVAAATAGTAPLTPTVDRESGLPEHIATAARAAARDHASAPWLTADEMFVRVARPFGGDRLLAAVLHELRATDGPPQANSALSAAA